MGSSFGGSIKLSGESEYKKALREIDSSLRVLGSEMKEVTSQFDKNDRSTENLAKQNDVLTKKISEQKEKVEVLKKALKASAEETGENSEKTKRYQTQLNNAQAELNTMNRQLETNKKDMKSAEEATDGEKRAIKEVGEVADKTSGKLKAMGGALKAAVAAAAAVGTAAVAAGKKIWDMANDTAAAGDEVDKMSQKIGISTKAYQEWGYVFERSGANIDGLQNGMKTLNNVLADAANGSASAQEKLKAVGLSIEDLNGKSSDEQLNIVIAALQNMEAGAQRSAAASDLFGKSASDMAAVLNMTAGETQGLKDEAKKYGMVMSDDAVKASAAFKDSLTKLDGTITGVKNNMIGKLLPGLNQVIDGFTELVSGSKKGGDMIKTGINSVIASVNDIIPQAVELLGVIAESLLDSAPDVIESLASGIIDLLPDFLEMALSDVLPRLITTAVTILKNLVSSLSIALPDIMVALSEGLMTIMNALFSPENLTQTIEIIIGAIEGVIGGLKQSLPILIEGASTLIQGIISALPEIFSLLVDEIPTLIDMIFDSENGLLSANNIGMLIDGVIKAAMAIVQNLPVIVLKLTEAIPDIIDHLFSEDNGFLSADNIGKLVNGVIDVVKELVKNTPKILLRILEKIPDIIDSILEAFGSIVERFAELGQEALFAFLDVFYNNDFFRGITSFGNPQGATLYDLAKQNYNEARKSIKSESEKRKLREQLYYEAVLYEDSKWRARIGNHAEGGVFYRPTLGLFAENGAEAVVPLKNNTEWINEVAKQMTAATADLTRAGANFYANQAPAAAPSYSVSVQFNDVKIASDLDIYDVADKVSETIAQNIINQGRNFS